MIIYHWKRKGNRFEGDCSEYIILARTEESFLRGTLKGGTIQRAIKSETARGFELVRKYDTDLSSDSLDLLLNRPLQVR